MTTSAKHPKIDDTARRWLSVLAGVLMMLCVGSNHAISAWNAQLKVALAYSQAEISLVCSMFSFGAYFSVTPGYIYDHLGAHMSVLLCAVIMGAIYLAMAAGTTAHARWTNAWIVSLLFLVVGQLSNFAVLAALGTNEGLFGERHRGKIMSITAAAFSGGGALFAVLYHRWFEGHIARFFVMLGVMLFLVQLFGWCALCRPARQLTVIGPDRPTEKTRLTSPADVTLEVQTIEAVAVDVYGRRLLTDARFWLLFVIIFINVGAALFIMSNISFIAESLQGSLDHVPTLVALFSVGNCVGRVCAGAVSDHVVHWWPRINMMSVGALIMTAAQVCFLVLPPAYLAIPVTLAGTADGVMFAVFPVLVRELFGLLHFGKNYGTLNIASAIGFPLFFSPISTLLYKHHAVHVDGVEKCFGRVCFSHVFVLMGVLSIVSFLASRRLKAWCYGSVQIE
ncbi:TPA: hypothetical protein N0F65_008264 [Lagenidium giganteum]|uniref:Uncharacterized protein n=1 Tax=Lagenidium giganteum TaxID=4803 RepID=A0AAV2YU66_9STRA|nr:TPA: hypothetical protein N0F65_008264 [Lagenidium giganteum]